MNRPRYITLIEHHITSGEAFKDIYEEMDKNKREWFEIEKQSLLRKYKDSQLELPYKPPYRDWLFLTIRGIVDSKMHEHLYKINSVVNISSFSDFVYSWLGCFWVDNAQREIRWLEFYELDHVDNYRLQLLLGLKANLEPKMWEYSTFIDFLEEKHSNDEIHFYLLCRYFLFGGPRLNTRASKFDRVQLIPMEVSLNLS